MNTTRISTLIQDSRLPIVDILDEFSVKLNDYPAVIISAEPGAGKTTILPLALLATLKLGKKIIVLEPRRIAAKNAAMRMSQLLGQPVGDSVGFRVRNETRVSKNTQIEVVTEAVFTRMIQSDPELAQVDYVLFDEFHERSLSSDLGLAFAIDVQNSLREDLKIIVMSATLEVEKVLKLFHRASLIQSKGREFPVMVQHRPVAKHDDMRVTLVRVIKEFIKLQKESHYPPNILCFFPGIKEIKTSMDFLNESFSSDREIQIFELHGSLPFKQQQQVLCNDIQVRKVILATNIAEASITIDGVGCVIDSGMSRYAQFDPNVGFDRLKTVRVSAHSAEQRKGRAGRLAAGICYRLWPQSQILREASVPEILRTDLSSALLEMSLWGVKSPQALALVEQPNLGSIAQAQQLLKQLGAIDQQLNITPHGKLMTRFGAHPRIAHMIIRAKDFRLVELACLAAALLEEKDVFLGQREHDANFFNRIQHCLEVSALNHQVQRVLKQSDRFRKLAMTAGLLKSETSQIKAFPEDLAKLLAFAFPDRIAQRRGSGYKLASGTGVKPPQNDFFKSEFIVISQLVGQANNTRIFHGVEIGLEVLQDLFADTIKAVEVTFWDEQSQSVRCERQTRLAEIVLSNQPVKNFSPQAMTNGLLEGVKRNGIEKLPWSECAKQWLAKLRLIKGKTRFCSDVPDISEGWLVENLATWLGPCIVGLTKISQIDEKVVVNALQNLVSWQTLQQIEALMPERIKVASGSQIKVNYLHGDKPVLAVKLQEMFGETETPRLANGEISVVVHLLSPAGRPLQITEDLAHFWQTSYQEVKKEMRGRYPKHPWPDDPLNAEATRYTKKRSKT
ncbi:ATP-dependent helicase HrpB [Aliikangiella marina]|uniref:ATP-dependent helicase HrpB n=1 Tax=Aliikangiella marina TaxID=1712262 RepID=UPI00163DC50B|nr:ATP-dependent helicase HrpB [Aliikangiella marina]